MARACVTVLIIGTALGLVACGGGSGGSAPEATRDAHPAAVVAHAAAVTYAGADEDSGGEERDRDAHAVPHARGRDRDRDRDAVQDTDCDADPHGGGRHADADQNGPPAERDSHARADRHAAPDHRRGDADAHRHADGDGRHDDIDSSTPWGWIVAGILAVAALAAGAVALARRSRQRKVADRWRSSATDAYGQATLIDDLAVREPPASPELHRRIDDARATFYALASSGPDLPSMQAAHMVYAALGELDTALRAAPPVAGPEDSTIGEARGSLMRALAQLGTLLGIPAFPGETSGAT